MIKFLKLQGYSKPRFLMANSNAEQQKNGFFTWKKTRWFVAHLICYSILLVGSITTATGGFKGIPYALANIYPLNLITFPTYIIHILCLFSVFSGFSSFWSSYQDTLLPYCYYFLDYTHNLILYLLGKSDSLKITRSQTIDDVISNCQTDLIKTEQRNNDYNRQITETLENLRKHNNISEKLYNDILKQLLSCQERIINKSPRITTEKTLSYKDYLRIILANSLKIFSLIIVAIGSLVVISMGVLTNQSFLQYTGIAIGGFAMSACVIASIFKQACQLSFSAIKQYQVLPSIFGIIPSKDKQKKEFKNILINKIQHQNAISQDFEKLKTQLEKITEDLQKKQKVVSTPILFFKDRKNTLPSYLLNDDDTKLMLQKEEDTVLEIMKLHMKV